MRNGRIIQLEIEQLLVARPQAQEAQTRAEGLRAEADFLETELLSSLQHGAQVERGRYGLLTGTSVVRSVAWRRAVERTLAIRPD